jgi:putative ABC transport system permease protein
MGRQPDSPRPAGLPKVGVWESGADTSGDWHAGAGYGGTVTDVYIGWWGLAASLVPLLVVVGISAGRRLGLERDLVVATVRAVAQLVLAGWALTLLLDEGTSIIWAWAWVAAMVPVAGDAARRREPRLRGLGLTTTLGASLGLAVSLATVFALGILPLEARVLVPVSGMVVGNSLKVVVVASTRLVDGIRDRAGEVEAMLALGFAPERAVRDVTSEALRLALRPQIEITRTAGMVFLPGALTGLILAGVDPLQAALIQVAILFLILGTAAVTALVVVLLGVRTFITDDQRLVPPVG